MHVIVPGHGPQSIQTPKLNPEPQSQSIPHSAGVAHELRSCTSQLGQAQSSGQLQGPSPSQPSHQPSPHGNQHVSPAQDTPGDEQLAEQGGHAGPPAVACAVLPASDP